MRFLVLGFLMAALAGPGAVCGASGQPAEVRELTSFRQFRALAVEQASQGQPVRFNGVVICYDAAWGQFYIHDSSETKWFSPLVFNKQLEPGQYVEITGTTTVLEGSPALTNLNLAVKGHQVLPAPTRLEIRQFAREFGQWVETTGQVRVAETSWGRLALVLAAEGQSCLVYVMGLPPGNDFKRFVGCKVRVRGINASKISNGRLTAASLFAPGLDEIAILEPSNLNPARVPVVSIDSLLNRELGTWTNSMDHINGVVSSYKPGEYIEVKDPTGVIRAKVVQITRVQLEDRVDLWGFFTVQGNEPVLADGYFEALRDPLKNTAGSFSGTPAGGTNTGPELQHAADILALTKEKAAWHLPVRLHGVITYADPEWHNMFFHDGSADIYAETTQSDVRAGQWVELTGRTSRGGFAPEVTNAAVTVLGITNLPVPARVDLEDLANGTLDAHWVQLEGVVRRVTEEWSHVNLNVMTRQGRFRVILPNFSNQPPPTHLVDALVSVQGACSSQLNARGQLSSIALHVPGLEQIRVLEGVSPNAFAARTIPIETVATFDPERLAGRRVKISGVVTLLLPGRGFIIQDSTGGIRASTAQQTDLQVGEAVDVLGFPTMGEFSPCLEEATVRRTGPGHPPRPAKTTAEQILAQGTNDMRLVQLQATLVQGIPQSARQRLVLQDGPIIFSANFQASGQGQHLPPWASGTVVRLTGVCSIQGNEQHDPETFRLLLAGANEVILVTPAPWWTRRHTIFLAGSLVGAILLALAWVGLLRRQVRAQTELIRANQKDLLETSRQAGMAEVATAVLHNVGNVLTSVNVSSNLMADKLKQSKVGSLAKAVGLLEQHQTELGAFLTRDPKGKQLPSFLARLSGVLIREQQGLLEEIKLLHKNIEHIKEIVAMQQSYARVSGVSEVVQPKDLVEDAIRMNASALERHEVRIVREYDAKIPQISTERHKVLQIVVNLLHNAKYACEESGRPDKQIIVRLANGDGRVKLSVIDNGIGIPKENLTRIFNHGFTTRKGGHGFGLHSGALAAKEMGGALRVDSEGPGQGARFTLELPLSPQSKP
ncbi:MAG TPA: HAMP domain-containing sensor histidine kinase [Candidatus Binatia bacterium]|nr:HAMP domain-containing sensor histidine kinase [Candidatus Binatia bacterium]